jgi:hypothetical protein
MRFVFLLSRDRLCAVWRDQHALRDQGRVVWGFLVQANQSLFDPGNRWVLPASVLYSPSTYFDDRVPLLEGVARDLFRLKGNMPEDEELKPFARALTDEMARPMRLQLPRSLCEGKKAYLTTCLIQPSHLPGGYLAVGYFPLLIWPEGTKSVMVLPARYWPEELRELWRESPDDAPPDRD